MSSKNEFFAKDAQSVGERGHVHEKTRALRAHHEEHEERCPRERGASFAVALQDQVRTAEHQFGGQQGATMDRQVSRASIFLAGRALFLAFVGGASLLLFYYVI